jgi:hypothetical protein
MSSLFSYSVLTRLPRDDVWRLFADIANWHQVSGICDDLQWAGEPWQAGSRIVAVYQHPETGKSQYVVESCAPPKSVRLVAYGSPAGLATGRTIRFEQLGHGTLIKVNSYTIGEPGVQLPYGIERSMHDTAVRLWDAFGLLCDCQYVLPTGGEPSLGHDLVVWNRPTQEWFCARCGRPSGCPVWEDARRELDLFECASPPSMSPDPSV